MKLSKKILFFLCSSAAVCNSVDAAPSLCKPAESVVFSCLTKTSKIISLCLDERRNEISYRYGRKDSIEISHTAEENSKNGFFYNHYTRPSVEYSRIGFVTSGYEYSVFRNYDATEAASPRYGVAVSKDGDEKAQVACGSQVVDHMSRMISKLKCDESSALGCF
ncbi:hypothetical protein F4827_007002 [Paraburkholderia bannensis]|uniref:Uncharacterized protein n=1 Tax=Paraburkholderia bannensis TaxID=765414 RepID=A0A7W9U6C0_9BURK|nr:MULTISPECIES: hypothetical protein [Paraburkholderia]MBB3262122.1 hypothetical protein [Paraburkholderia sp. WP4_3_2]MBB6107121.1 hypothetical protein [Paraburkholderia bannensis]